MYPRWPPTVSIPDLSSSHTVYLLLVASGLALVLAFVWLMVRPTFTPRYISLLTDRSRLDREGVHKGHHGGTSCPPFLEKKPLTGGVDHACPLGGV